MHTITSDMPSGLCWQTIRGLWKMTEIPNSKQSLETRIHCKLPRIQCKWGIPQPMFGSIASYPEFRANEESPNLYLDQMQVTQNLVQVQITNPPTYIWINQLQSSAIIKRSDIISYCTNDYRNWGRISIRCWIQKRHPIARPLGVSCEYSWEIWPHYNGTALL